MSGPALLLRSLLWTVLIPGTVAGFVPWFFFGLDRVVIDWGDPLHLIGLLLVSAGAVLLVLCIWEFGARGRGTLAPVDPPRELVVGGLYRYVRNPMYLSVATILAGELLLTRSRGLLFFALVWFVVVNLAVIGYEEPALRRQFGESYTAYSSRVGRWLPRLARD